MHDDYVGVETIYSGGENKIEAKSVHSAIPSAVDLVQKNPREKLEEMRARDGRNFMPNDPAGICQALRRTASQRKICDALGVEMDFAMLVVRETLQHFSKRAFRAVAPIDKG
jgi:hypothetical protein